MRPLFQLSLFLLVTLTVSTAQAQGGPIETIIASEGVFAISDGSSTFQFLKGGKFVLDPVGMSGRTVRGTWTRTGAGKFTVIGRWGWMNGASVQDDLRRMKIYVSCTDGAATKHLPRSGLKVRACYFSLDELVKISRAEFDAVKR